MASYSSHITSIESDGTSFAAPAVAGEAALLMSENASLKMWPEAVRAAGEKKRVVVAWNSESMGAYGSDRLNVDLDLIIKSTTGIYLGNSTSWDNNYEIVEFTAPGDGIYTAEIHKHRSLLYT